MSVCLCVLAYMSPRRRSRGGSRSPGRACGTQEWVLGAPLPLRWPYRTPIPALSTDCTPTPSVSRDLSPPVPISLAWPGTGQWGVASYPSPLAPGPLPRALLALRTRGGWGWGWGEALKAGDCLGELRDRAPIVPAPEPPQWSSAAQRGFDNGQPISMQSLPLSPLPVPQPRGGSWGLLACLWRQGVGQRRDGREVSP